MTKFGRYDVVAKIGEGGFGEVFEAYDPDLKRRVAIKTCSSGEPELIARFEQEAALAGSLHHRNLTATYDFSSQDGVPYLVQEFLEGEDLDQKISRADDLSVTTRLQYLIQLARGLRHAHGHRVIHRDVKPSNVRVLPDGLIKLMDFGIAQSLDDDVQLTLAGETMGTAAYLAPEQIRGERVDRRCDVYSFGVTAYELFCFKRPFPGDDSDTVLQAVMDSEPAPITEHWPGCPEAVSALIQRCLHKNPDDRYDDFGSVLRDFDSILGEDSGQSRASDFSRAVDSPTGVDDATIVMSAAQAAGAGLPVESHAPETGSSGDVERTQLLEQPTIAFQSPVATQAARSTVGASSDEAPKGLSLLSFVIGLALMGALGAVAATWFFGRDIPPGSSTSLTAVVSEQTATPTPDTENLSPSAALPPTEAGIGSAVAAPELGVLVLQAAWNPKMTARVADRTFTLDRIQQVKLPVGNHTVLFRLEDDPTTGWNESQSERRPVRIQANRNTQLETRLERPGAVTIRAALGAPQAFIRIDGDPMGWAPISERAMPPGNYQVNASTSPTESANATLFPVTVNAGEETVITFNIDSDEPPIISNKPWAP